MLVLIGCVSAVGSSFGQAHRASQLSRAAYEVARSNPDSSLTLANQALHLAQQAGSAQEQARAHAVLARTSIFKSDLSGINSHVTAGLVFARQAGNDTLLSDLYNLSALNYRFQHKTDSALAALASAERYARKGKMPTQLANALTAKAALLNDRRQYARALDAYEECYRINVDIKDEIGQALALQNIGQTLLQLDRLDAALRAYRQAEVLARKQNDTHGLIRVLISMGNAYYQKRSIDSSNTYYHEAYDLAGKFGDNIAQGAVANNLSTNAISQGLNEQTRFWARRAVNHYYATGDSARAASSLGNLGDAERMAGHVKEAIPLLEKALGYAQKLGETKILAQTLKMLGQAYIKDGRADSAAPLLLEYAALQDTLYKQNLAEEVADFEAQHEAFIKDQKIKLLNQENELNKLAIQQKDLRLQRRTLLGLVVALVLLGVVGILYFSAKRRRLRQEARHQRQLLEEQAQRHAASIAAEEAERKRIARELHDGLGQMLASVRLHMAARSTPGQDFSDLEQMLAESSDEVRFISHNLMPQALERKGFDPAVEEFCERVARTKKLNLNRHLEPVGHLLSPVTSQMLYRVMQELVSNVLKHAQATDLFITLVPEEGEVSLTVEDNGKGFDLATALQKEGIGLANLQARVAQAGGTVDMESQPGQGSLFVVRVPVRVAVPKADKPVEAASNV